MFSFSRFSKLVVRVIIRFSELTGRIINSMAFVLISLMLLMIFLAILLFSTIGWSKNTAVSLASFIFFIIIACFFMVWSEKREEKKKKIKNKNSLNP